MMILCSPEGIVNIDRPAQGIKSIVKAGFESTMLDMSMYCSPNELENIGRDVKKNIANAASEEPAYIREYCRKMLGACKENNLQVPIARAPYLLRNTKHTDGNELMFRLAEESIKICGQNGCEYAVIRPLFAGIESRKEWEINREYYLRLAKIAQEHQVLILLENQCRSLNGHMVRGICAEGSEAARWVDELNAATGEERVGCCLDVGVCNLCGQNMQDVVGALGDRLKAVIFRDCDGQNENAMLPFTCVSNRQAQTDWLSLVRGLQENGFDGLMILNIADTSASFSSLLRPSLLVLAKSVADYFEWQIGIEKPLKKYKTIVLFGAGNMCRNYMKCYGEKYPPLFTCDNNQKLWGSTFCGLEVKRPEVLKELPDDCGIFICNVFYHEIEEQLRNMGIKNIEFFNDEYMPSFYFDRLKGV